MLLRLISMRERRRKEGRPRVAFDDELFVGIGPRANERGRGFDL